MARAYVSIGSNVEREMNIRAALGALEHCFGSLAVSSVYESCAVGFTGRNFYNLVVGFATEKDPREVQRELKGIEDRQGRVRTGPRFADRTLDLDLLIHGDLVIEEDELELPRPELLESAFILCPLAEIAGDSCHPVVGKSYRELWQAFTATGQDLWPVAFER